MCRECGAKVTYSNSVRLHPSKVVCEKCRPRTVIRLTGKAKQVFSYMALLAKYRGNTTLGELRNEKLYR